MKTRPRTYRFPEQANRTVPVCLALVMIMMLVQTFLTFDPSIGLLNNLWNQAGVLFIVVLGLCGAVSLGFRQTVINITSFAIEQRSRIGPFSRTRKFSPRDVSVRVEVFAFDPWDPHLALHCGEETLRFGWGLPEARLREIADDMRFQLDAVA